ncbi:hypothetical protein PSPO01_11605 [Paraphaeosphaeria sporulosa]
MPALTFRPRNPPPPPIAELLQTTFEGLAALVACLALAFTLWKFRGKFRAHYHRRRRRQRSFELEAQLPEVWVTSMG